MKKWKKKQKKPGKTGKNRTNRIREVLFHVPKLYWDCIMVFGKRSSCLHGSQWAADSAALPLDVDMAGGVRGWDQNLIFWIQASFYRSERSLITTECWISKLCVFPTTLLVMVFYDNLHPFTPLKSQNLNYTLRKNSTISFPGAPSRENRPEMQPF